MPLFFECNNCNIREETDRWSPDLDQSCDSCGLDICVNCGLEESAGIWLCNECYASEYPDPDDLPLD